MRRNGRDPPDETPFRRTDGNAMADRWAQNVVVTLARHEN